MGSRSKRHQAIAELKAERSLTEAERAELDKREFRERRNDVIQDAVSSGFRYFFRELFKAMFGGSRRRRSRW